MSDSITANVVIGMPSQLFTLARSFKANANGKIYISKIDTPPGEMTDPDNYVQVYLENEDGSHVPMAQPIIINSGGFPVYNGQIAKFVTVEGHAMAVYNAYNVQEFYYPNVLKYDPDQFEQRLAGPNGAYVIGHDSNTVGGSIDANSIAIENNSLKVRGMIPSTDRRIIVNAHRGYSETYLEQTLMAFSQCQSEAYEIDMQTSSDGYPVCFHDDDLSIQTNGSGSISGNTISTISALRFKRAIGTKYEDMAGIPGLGAVCKMALRRGKKLLAEIKGYRTIDDCAMYNQIIGQYGLNISTTYICFDFAPLQFIRNINDQSSFGWIINSYNPGMDATIATLASWGGSVLGINKNALASIGIDKLRQWEFMGLTLNTWTVYTPQELQVVLDYGIRSVTLDKEYANILNN